MLKFQEIEHKYLVDEAFDLGAFEATAQRLKPVKSHRVKVRDTYYVVAGLPGHILRHRIDSELQQLSVKSLAADNECRTEVNLDLGHHRGDQSAAVQAFIQPMDLLWSGSIEKNINVFYFSGCEVVHYTAVAKAGLDTGLKARRTVHCVEFEAIMEPGQLPEVTREGALAAISVYEKAFGFQPDSRCRQSLFELLFADSLPENVSNFMNSRR